MDNFDQVELAAGILSAFVSNNSVPVGELAGLLGTLHAAIADIAAGKPSEPSATPAPTPAVSIRKSVTPDYLICLDDGKQFRSLKRHLTTLGMTPDQYRAKWSLPNDYPMVAPSYAAQRSELAKQIGLGKIRSTDVEAGAASGGKRKAGASRKAQG